MSIHQSRHHIDHKIMLQKTQVQSLMSNQSWFNPKLSWRPTKKTHCPSPDLGESCQASEHPQVACRVQDDLSGQVALGGLRQALVGCLWIPMTTANLKAILSSWRHTECSHIWTSVEGLKVPTIQNTKVLWNSKDLHWGIGPIHGHRPTSKRPDQKDLYHRVIN